MKSRRPLFLRFVDGFSQSNRRGQNGSTESSTDAILAASWRNGYSSIPGNQNKKLNYNFEKVFKTLHWIRRNPS